MKVSILIPTKDRLALLQEAVGSARAQTHGDLEIVVSDDGSSDGTQAWLDEVVASDGRVRLTPRNPTPGLFENMNHLIDHVRGEAFCVLADDDRLHPEFVARLLEPLRRSSDLVASFASFWIIDANGNRLEDESRDDPVRTGRAALPAGVVAEPVLAALRNMMVLGFTLYRTGLIARERFDLTCGGAADIDFGIRIAALGRFVYIPERLADVRLHPQRASALRYRYIAGGKIRALAKHRFKHASWETFRLEMLQGTRVGYAVHMSTIDRIECLKTVTSYIADSRSLPPMRDVASLAAAVTLTCLPRRSANHLVQAAKALRSRR